MRKLTVSRMRERYAQTVLTFRITYVECFINLGILDVISWLLQFSAIMDGTRRQSGHVRTKIIVDIVVGYRQYKHSNPQLVFSTLAWFYTCFEIANYCYMLCTNTTKNYLHVRNQGKLFSEISIYHFKGRLQI